MVKHASDRTGCPEQRPAGILDRVSSPRSSLDIVTLGESMVLFLAQQSGPLREASTFERHVGGAESNVAIGLCRLQHSAGWISRVGDDELGRAILFRLRGEGVDLSRVIVDPEAPTGVMVRERREVGPLDVAYYRKGSAASRLAPSDIDEGYVAGAKALHLTGITPALSASCRETTFAAAEVARAAGVRVVLDPNIRRKLWTADAARTTLRDLAAKADVVLPGADEAELLTGSSDPLTAARDLLSLGPELVVVKLGAEGAIAVTVDRVVRAPGVALPRVVDPVGAGDAFAAGLHAGWLRNLSLEDTLALANRCGAVATTVAGDIEALPRWDEVAATRSAGSDVVR
jgi:2-dehydro-3-deoxygluconokinase